MADTGRPAPDPIYDFVAVGRRAGEIVLATPALGPGNHWRFRRISVEPKTAEIGSAELSRSGTKLLVTFKDGTERLVDLTRSIESISESEAQPQSHTLPAESSSAHDPTRDQLEFPLAAGARHDLLVANLRKESGGGYQWSFFHVKPAPALYAPVLEFAPGETSFPSDTTIWDVLNPMSKGTTREAYQSAYDTLGDARWGRCTAYYRATSYPGSWLLEYWYYYPFDEGKPHRHIHDSEHVFIEVDKLGGAVRSFIASDHGSFAPNNGYSTFVRGAQPISLPLFVMVELDKHAMSPDINRDAEFTRGVDENMWPLKYEAWGVRDVATQPQHLMKSYNPVMTLPRKAEDRMALRDAAQYFPGLEVPAEKAVCSLMPLPEGVPGAADAVMATPTGAQAMHHLLDHPDSQHVRAIYKPWVLPYRQLRLGVAPFDHSANHDQLYAAYVMDIPHLTHGALIVPGRIALEAMWSPSSHPETLSSGGHTLSGTISSEMYLGVRYEGFFSHTQGYYFGVTRRSAASPRKQWTASPSHAAPNGSTTWCGTAQATCSSCPAASTGT